MLIINIATRLDRSRRCNRRGRCPTQPWHHYHRQHHHHHHHLITRALFLRFSDPGHSLFSLSLSLSLCVCVCLFVCWHQEPVEEWTALFDEDGNTYWSVRTHTPPAHSPFGHNLGLTLTLDVIIALPLAPYMLSCSPSPSPSPSPPFRPSARV